MSSYYEYTAECDVCIIGYQDITSERHGVWDWDKAQIMLSELGWRRNSEGDWECPKCISKPADT